MVQKKQVFNSLTIGIKRCFSVEPVDRAVEPFVCGTEVWRHKLSVVQRFQSGSSMMIAGGNPPIKNGGITAEREHRQQQDNQRPHFNTNLYQKETDTYTFQGSARAWGSPQSPREL